MDITQITDFLNQLYAFIAVPNNLILVALMALGVLFKIMLVPKKFIVPLLLALGISASLALIKPAAVAVLSGIVFVAISVLFYETILKYLVRKFLPDNDLLNDQTKEIKEIK